MRALSFLVDATAWTALAERLEQAGALALTESDGDTLLFDEPNREEPASWSRFRIEALFDAGSDIDAVAAMVAATDGTQAITLREVEDIDWVRRSQDAWTPRAFGGGLWICPSWCEPPAEARHLLRLDPGQAFGTGSHETTALCLDWLAQTTCREETVIDYGCGSGILAMAAACFGAGQVYGVDIDDAAIAAARENVSANDLEARVVIGADERVDGVVADRLVANILLEPLLDLAEVFAALVRPGGALALAGLLEEQAALVLERYAGAFTMNRHGQRGGWVLLTGQRRLGRSLRSLSGR